MTNDITYTCEKCGVRTVHEVAIEHRPCGHDGKCEGKWIIGTPHLRLRILGVESDQVRFQIAEQKWNGRHDFLPWEPDDETADWKGPEGTWISTAMTGPQIGPFGFLVYGTIHRGNEVMLCSVARFLLVARAVMAYCTKAAEWEKAQKSEPLRCDECGAFLMLGDPPNMVGEPRRCLVCKNKRDAELAAVKAEDGEAKGEEGANYQKYRGASVEGARPLLRCRYAAPVEIKDRDGEPFEIRLDGRRHFRRPGWLSEEFVAELHREFRKFVARNEREYPTCKYGGTVHILPKTAGGRSIGFYLCDRCSKGKP